jgi:ABC-2 type transport system permease protein
MYASAFLGLMLRDTRVLQREFVPFMIRTVMNPLLFVFVFTYVFPKIGQGIPGTGGENFATVLVPGLVAVAMVTQGIFAAALPLVQEFSTTHEIEDRVMAPLPVGAVAFEKVAFSAIQAVIAGLVVFPLVYVVPTSPVEVHVDNWFLLAIIMVLAAFTSGALGLAIGTSFNPRQVSMIFAIIVVPMTFLGCVYYPWEELEAVRWLQIVVLINPLVYMSEGLRMTLTPSLPHMPAAVVLGALTASFLALTGIGVRNFKRRILT